MKLSEAMYEVKVLEMSVEKDKELVKFVPGPEIKNFLVNCEERINKLNDLNNKVEKTKQNTLLQDKSLLETEIILLSISSKLSILTELLKNQSLTIDQRTNVYSQLNLFQESHNTLLSGINKSFSETELIK
jgi:hypothetical protein